MDDGKACYGSSSLHQRHCSNPACMTRFVKVKNTDNVEGIGCEWLVCSNSGAMNFTRKT